MANIWFPFRFRKPSVPNVAQKGGLAPENIKGVGNDQSKIATPPKTRGTNANASLGSDLDPAQVKAQYPKGWTPEQIADFEKQLAGLMAGGPNVLQPPAAPRHHEQLTTEAQDLVDTFSRAKNIVMAPNQLKYTPHGRLAFQLAVDVIVMVGRHRAAVELLDQAMPALIAARDVDERPDSENLGRLKKALNG